MAAAPFFSAIFASSTAVMFSSSQPFRIFTVTGMSTALLTAFIISPAKSGFFIRLAPPPFIAILGAGQPIFMSIIFG